MSLSWVRLCMISLIVKNTVISPNFMVCKFSGKVQFPQGFGQVARNYAETTFPQNFHPRKLDKITVLFAKSDDHNLTSKKPSSQSRSSCPEVLCNFIQKQTLAQAFSCEFCKTFKNTFYYRTYPVTASANSYFYLTSGSSCLKCSLYKVGIYFKNDLSPAFLYFSKLRGKHLCRSFFNKVLECRPATLLKRDY